MSLNQSVTKAVNEIINDFIKKIATKYDLDPNELLSVWDNKEIKNTDKKILDTSPDKDQNDLSHKFPRLADLC